MRNLLALFCAAAVLSCATPSPGQPNAQPNPAMQDPLLNLMMSQPRLDLNAPVRATADFEPPLVRVGQKAIYRITLSALEQSIQITSAPPATAGIVLSPSAHGQVLQMNGTNMEPRTTFHWRAQAKSPGTFVVPEHTVLAYGKPVRVPAAQLQVAPAHAYIPDSGQRLELEFTSTNLFIGQPVNARIILRGNLGGIVQGISQVQINGSGLMTDMGAVRQRIENRLIGNTNQPAYVYETLVTPMNTGRIEAFAQAFTMGNRFSSGAFIGSGGQIVIGGGIPQYVLLESDPVGLQVKPLPRAGELPGFTGAIGEFSLDPPRLSTNQFVVGQPVKLTVVARAANANLARIAPPPAPRSREWQILEPGSDGTARQISAQSVNTFEYTLIPLTSAVTGTPKIPFSYFNPDTGEHVDLSIPSLPVTVQPGPMEAHLELLASAELLSEAEPEPTLGTITRDPGRSVDSLTPLIQRGWFPVLQVAPALGFFGLWLWDRRRRYLEAHPEVVRRQQALRQLRRGRKRLARALEARDAEAFVQTSVEALCVATAPHYPATPRALVGADVLALLTPEEQQGAFGVTVRRLFNLSDAQRFQGEHLSGDVLHLAPVAQQVLTTLEQRLRQNWKPAPPQARLRVEEEEELAPASNSRAIAAWLALGLSATLLLGAASKADFLERFAGGVVAYESGDYRQAALRLREAARLSPSTGVFQNLGNSEWQRGRVGHAVQAWEQALYIDPWNQSARQSLDYARRFSQLESPQHGWFEVVASWLPLNSWAWIAGASLWMAVGMLTIPGILRLPRAGWHQAAAALGFAAFLLSMPAHLGVHSRAKTGFVLLNNTHLRLTPTTDAQDVTRLTAGDPIRLERVRGDYVLVKASHARGWLTREEIGLLTDLPK